MVENKEIIKVENNNTQSWEERLKKEAVFSPAVNVFENSDAYVLVADMPGVSKENIRIKLHKRELSIVGLVNFEELTNRKYILREISVGNYYRKFNLSDWIDEDNIDASFQNGQLKITLPKHERVKPRDIQIL
ncbi:MAG: Hsp20/alpha crystallin family protein [Ignavibacteriaceae bacterium]|nr:Hsp20/alpha crystallin family protein [Ignavibacteriaceae bacterium]